jgi:1-acyl-sn-glycerol-3-phosphate acyltransferase
MFYFFQLALLFTVTIPLAVLTILLGLVEPYGKRVYRINQFWTWIILRLGGITLKIEGEDNIDPKRPYIFMVNHQSNIDIPVLVQALTRFQLRLIAKKELFRVPFFGWAMWATKHIAVDRADPANAVKSLQRAKEKIAAGISVVVFPEGTRSRDGRLLRFKKGGFLLAVQAHTQIVPVTINGSGTVLPSGAWRLHSGLIEVVIGKPIAVEGHRAGKLRVLSDEVRQAIAANLRPAEPAYANSADSHAAIDVRSWENQRT